LLWLVVVVVLVPGGGRLGLHCPVRSWWGDLVAGAAAENAGGVRPLSCTQGVHLVLSWGGNGVWTVAFDAGVHTWLEGWYLALAFAGRLPSLLMAETVINKICKAG